MADITTYFLEMLSPSDIRSKAPVTGLDILHCEIKIPEYNRFLYELVGEHWKWRDRLSWSNQEWDVFVHDPSLETWVAYFRGAPAGYYELQQQEDGDVEIVSFGLAPQFIGKGIGGFFLSHALQRAWSHQDTRRVWVHTCSQDHPSALHNYLARGLRLYKEMNQATT